MLVQRRRQPLQARSALTSPGTPSRTTRRPVKLRELRRIAFVFVRAGAEGQAVAEREHAPHRAQAAPVSRC